jgi:hypothetical protein
LLEGQAIPQTLQAEKREYNELLRPSSASQHSALLCPRTRR